MQAEKRAWKSGSAQTPQLRREGFLQLYKSMGFSVIPLAPSSKKPLIEWEEYQSRKADDAQVEEWFRACNANIGLVCGAVSGGLVVQDFENYEDYSAFYTSHEKLEGKTMVVRTPHGGVHVYWLCDSIVRRRIRLSEDHPLDLLGEGGYVAAPPSVVDGRRYEVIGCLQIEQLTEDIYEATVRRCRQLGWKTRAKLPIRRIIQGVPEGFRNDSAFKYAYHLPHTVKLDRDTIWLELKRWNQHNEPPLPEKELAQILESALRYESAGRERIRADANWG